MPTVSKAQVSKDLGARIQSKKRRVSGGWSLGVAKVVTVNYEEFKVTLRVVLGEDQEFQRVPVPLTFPGAGARHFFGAMPQVGDMCVIGHMTQESKEDTKTPIILAWIIPGTYMGHDWTLTSPFSPDEYSMDPKDAAFVDGAFHKQRHKLRHMNPGNILASSAQGADLILDEGATLSNRRGNEVTLRDQDQAMVVRSLQEFHALAGARVYAGMVQRDATFLPSQMISDGIEWDAQKLIDRENNEPLDDFSLEASGHPYGQLNPATVFDKTTGGIVGDVPLSGIVVDPNLDPYLFLERGLFVTSEGYTYDGKTQSEAVYGGKPYFRVGLSDDVTKAPQNAALGQQESLTEYRIELSHTSDGTLPVTEQTDGFDAERLPRASLTSPDTLPPSRYIEVVYGSVVGNDPYSVAGRQIYGIPIKPVVFDLGGSRSPSLGSALGAPLGEHGATLFRLTPLVSPAGSPTWWSVTKDGRFKASIAGPQSAPFSAEVALESGLHVSSGGKIRLDADQGFDLRLKGDQASNEGLNLSVPNGAVKLYGGGKSSTDAFSKQISPTGDGSQDAAGLMLEARFNAELKAGRKVSLLGNEVESKSSGYTVNAMNGVSVQAGEKIAMSSKVLSMVTNGKFSHAIHGPQDLLPTNGPFREIKITGIGVGTVDEYQMQLGDRKETILTGNHTTTVVVGNLTYETGLGVWKAAAGTNNMTIDSVSGASLNVPVGNFTASVLAGAVSIIGQTNVLVKSSGPAVFSGTSGVTLGGPGKVGSIICSSDLDPLTGAPLATYGMGSPGHLLGPAS